MIWSTTPDAGLYFANSLRSFAHDGSSVGYGRYSSTSRAHWAGLGMPAAVRAACISTRVAVLALTFFTAVTALDVALGVAAVVDAGADDVAVPAGALTTVVGVVVAAGSGSPEQAAVAAATIRRPARPTRRHIIRKVICAPCRTRSALTMLTTLGALRGLVVLLVLIVIMFA